MREGGFLTNLLLAEIVFNLIFFLDLLCFLGVGIFLPLFFVAGISIFAFVVRFFGDFQSLANLAGTEILAGIADPGVRFVGLFLKREIEFLSDAENAIFFFASFLAALGDELGLLGLGSSKEATYMAVIHLNEFKIINRETNQRKILKPERLIKLKIQGSEYLLSFILIR